MDRTLKLFFIFNTNYSTYKIDKNIAKISWAGIMLQEIVEQLPIRKKIQKTTSINKNQQKSSAKFYFNENQL